MTSEMLALENREPAIRSELLRLTSGEYANKKTLQQITAAAGLPVPRLIDADELPSIFEAGREYRRHHPKEYGTANELSYCVYERGFFPLPMDMWAVDIVPTTLNESMQHVEQFQYFIKREAVNSQIATYLKHNFGVPILPKAQSFFQEAVPAGHYISTLSRGNRTFSTHKFDPDQRIVPFWYSFIGNTLVTNTPGYRSIGEDIAERVLPLASEASNALDHALSRRFEYKHDFLDTNEGVFLIQSRVASPAMTDIAILKEHRLITKYLEQGIPEIALETGEMGTLNQVAPRTPYVLSLSNYHHLGYKSSEVLRSLDMSGLIGLKLPAHLEGGLLEHNGYNIIAYALYWGLPIAIDRETD